jgi:membrane carboxypeptidase/penicillin-binding protein
MERYLEKPRRENPPRLGAVRPHFGALKRAVVAAEDAKFLDHEGFDWEAIQKAMAEERERGRVVAGASTISQQLPKNLFLSGSRSWLRKAQEAAITWMMERTLSKRRFLEIYLNVAERGEDGVFGARGRGAHHFGRSAAALDAPQAAWSPPPAEPAPLRARPHHAVPRRAASTPFSPHGSAQIPIDALIGLGHVGSAR